MAETVSNFTLRGHDRTKVAFASVKASMSAVSARARILGGTLASTLGVAGFGMAARQAIQYGSAVTDAATATNMSIRSVQVLGAAAIKAGSNQEQMNKAIIMMQKSAGEAADGMATYRDAFDALGINVENFRQLAPERQFEIIGRSVNESKNRIDAYKAALDILGTRNAPKLMEVLQRLGTDGFDQMAADAEAAGLIMSDSVANQMDVAADKIEEIKKRLTISTANIMGDVMSSEGRDKLLFSFMEVAARFGGSIKDNIISAVESSVPYMMAAFSLASEKLKFGIQDAKIVWYRAIQDHIFNKDSAAGREAAGKWKHAVDAIDSKTPSSQDIVSGRYSDLVKQFSFQKSNTNFAETDAAYWRDLRINAESAQAAIIAGLEAGKEKSGEWIAGGSGGTISPAVQAGKSEAMQTSSFADVNKRAQDFANKKAEKQRDDQIKELRLIRQAIEMDEEAVFA